MSNNSQIKTAVILASGYGKRMRKKERFPSKPMTFVNHKPLISYIIDLLICNGVEKIYIVYHSETEDVLNLLDFSKNYIKHLEFIKENIQKGTLLTFSRVKNLLSPPFIMVFEDIIANQFDFANMLSIGKKYITSDADLIIQTVGTPSILSEKAFLTEKGRIIEYRKNGITDEVNGNQIKKYGGMVYLWFSDPFQIMDEYLFNQNYKFSSFLYNYVLNHTVYEMPINDMWDVDTPEAVVATEEILKDWSNKYGGIKQC